VVGIYSVGSRWSFQIDFLNFSLAVFMLLKNPIELTGNCA